MKKGMLLFFVIILFSYNDIGGQEKTEIDYSKKIYSGTWQNEKTKRYLQFYFEDDVDYIIINDWTGNIDKSKSETLDAYKAYIKENKLIIPSENGDHHRSYCEISISNNELKYVCNGFLNFSDNALVKDKYFNQTVFKKLKK